MTFDTFLETLDAQNALLRDLPVNRIFAAIFEKQQALHKKYGEIERSNNFYAPLCSEQFTFTMQQCAWIRSKFWFVTEEISEAIDVLASPINNERAEDFFEELIDALHYMVEVSSFCDPRPEMLDTMFDTANRKSWGNLPDEALATMHLAPVIVEMGMAANQLKAKPWKQSYNGIEPHLASEFQARLNRAWLKFLQALKFFGMTKLHIYVLYCHKNEINQQRQRNGY